MANVGYKRVSTADQNTDRQLVDIQLDKVFEEFCSASTTERPVWLQTLDYLREGDKLYVHSLDRVCRSGAGDAVAIVEQLTAKQVSIEFVKEGLSFNSEMNAAQKGVLGILASVAQMERELIKERQKEGIAAAKAKGKRFGRPSKASSEEVKELRKTLSIAETARQLGISPATVNRLQKS
ncbi:recombinase family protein [uncultured Vibrio sp.]|uniref:recombinase family protein n=1 Tax=uncultured Vibrio sp. TaxID=114054 RepID=UPI00260A7FE4|nr:recombinase family protein [uncultured Vibrio sp.]